MMRTAAFLLLCAAAMAETIDQIAVTVDTQVILQSQILEQIRVTAFLNGDKPDFSPQNRRRTADRLIELALVEREMDLTRYTDPTVADIQDTLKQLRGRDLTAYRITQKQLEQSLVEQASLLRFIDLRFRPEVQVQETDVERYCENVFIPELRKKGVQVEGAGEEYSDKCREDFTARLVDARVDAWLKEARSRSRIVYQEDAFQ